MKNDNKKQLVHAFWNSASCGEELYFSGEDKGAFQEQARIRYQLEPYISEFAKFKESRGLRVLEVGVGLGADHQQFAEAGADLYGIDLTERAIAHTRKRLAMFECKSELSVGDAEHLDFADDKFDVVYSWGVLHHSPYTSQAILEVLRVLKPGGQARVMIYHYWSMVGLMLWLRYAICRGHPFRSLKEVYAEHLESPGTKAYSVKEARRLFEGFTSVHIRTVLTHGDLLASEAGQRHRGVVLAVARIIWPRRIIRWLFPWAGLFMLIEAEK